LLLSEPVTGVGWVQPLTGHSAITGDPAWSEDPKYNIPEASAMGELRDVVSTTVVGWHWHPATAHFRILPPPSNVSDQ
jgi:hypothetical protein